MESSTDAFDPGGEQDRERAEAPEETFMMPDELASYLRMTRSAIMRRVQTRSIPFLKIGNSVRFKRAKIMAWLAGNGTSEDLECIVIPAPKRKKSQKKVEAATKPEKPVPAPKKKKGGRPKKRGKGKKKNGN